MRQTLKTDISGQGGMVGMIIGLVITVILVVAVAIPVVNDVINNSGLSGTTKTIVQQIPILMAVVPLMAIAYLLMVRER